MKANLPENEIERLHKLQSLNLLDSPSEQQFDDLVRLAQLICQVPIAVISLVDAHRQWFKSCIGLGARETSRDLAFCAHAILQPNQVMIVENALEDERFFDNQLVLSDPNIRFYAGAPLVTPEGFALGTLCVIDTVPKQLTAEQVEGLERLASQASQLIRLRELSVEQMEHRDKLQREQQRMLNVIEGTSAGIWEWNIASGEVFLNNKWAEMLGYSLEELTPATIETWKCLIHPDDFLVAQELLEKHFRAELDYYDVKFRMLHKSGRWVWVHARGRLTEFDKNNQPLVMSGIHLDFTEPQKLYDDIQNQRQFLHNILSNLPGTVYRCSAFPIDGNMKWKIEFVSDNVSELTGHNANFYVGEFLDLFGQQMAPEDKYRVFTGISSAIAEHRPFKLEYRLRHSNGAYITVEDSGQGVYDQHGNILFMDGFICNIAERKLLQRQQIEMTKRLANLFEAAPIGIMRVEENLNIIEANPEMEKMLGYPRRGLVGVNIFSITPASAHEQSVQAIDVVREQGRFGPVIKEYIHKNGSILPVEISGATISTSLQAESDELSWWTLVKDMSEQQRIDRLKNEFISIVSHELRTPLTSISGALGIVNSGVLGVMPEKAAQLLAIAKRNSTRLTVLINDLLDMDKLMAGKMEFHLQPCSIEKLMQDAVTENQSYTESHGVKINLTGNYPNVPVYVDQLRFQQVLSNFISNAAKFSPAGASIDLTVEQQCDKIKISVRDYGSGIPEEFKNKIFSKFSQADASDTRAKGGTGLGLAISKQLTEKMGGTVGFTSELGKGSCFYATFPLATNLIGDTVNDAEAQLGNR